MCPKTIVTFHLVTYQPPDLFWCRWLWLATLCCSSSRFFRWRFRYYFEFINHYCHSLLLLKKRSLARGHIHIDQLSWFEQSWILNTISIGDITPVITFTLIRGETL